MLIPVEPLVSGSTLDWEEKKRQQKPPEVHGSISASSPRAALMVLLSARNL